jgi:hypothetical protein
MSSNNNPVSAPKYTIHRNAISAIDVIANVDRRKGINMAGYSKAHIQVVPDTVNAAPSVAVYWWSVQADGWIQEHTPIAKATPGAGVPYEFTVDCQHRIMFVAITAITADSATILIGGVPAATV